MLSIKPQLTDELEKHLGGKDIWRAPAFPVSTYRALVEHVARLAYANRNQLLFFRGQNKDYQSKAEGSTLYPAIYRGDNLLQAELEVRFKKLASSERALVNLFKSHKIEGSRDVSHKKYIQWSILQHYEVVATPLLDVTQSLRVACSFAQMASTDSQCFVYVLGLPFPTNRISVNSEEELVNIRLLSICPPAALRPYYQEGYMAGTPDVTNEYDVKTELDFRNRLIAKFGIPHTKSFWNDGFEITPRAALYPNNDKVEQLCRELIGRVEDEASAEGDVGKLLVEWARLEEKIVPLARHRSERNVSVGDAIRILLQQHLVPKDIAISLENVRRVRNLAAHAPSRVRDDEAQVAIRVLRDINKRLELPKA